jgi:hypothetical protein
MEEIIVFEKKYIQAETIIKEAPIYCKGVRNGRELIKKKEIDQKYFIYARLINNEWFQNEGKSVKFDKVLIKKSYIKKIPELNETNNKITDDKGIEKAPDIINLEDNEKFKDNEDNFIEIETRGEREVDKIYFKVKDVMIDFNMPNLYTTIIDKRTDGYIVNTHYKYFYCENLGISQIKTSKKTAEKELFLTYNGILRVLFASHSKNVEKFIHWATKTLFTVQMGSDIQKRELVSSVLGVTAKVVKEVFNADSKTLPCVYFFTLNTVKELRESMNIDNKYEDSSIVGKFGFTKDLSRRTGEHIKRYGEIKNSDLKLKHYSYIDPQYMSRAEKDIKDLMCAFGVRYNYKEEEELVIIPKNMIDIIGNQYEMIGKKYIGHISELINKIKELESRNEIIEERHKNEIMEERHKNEILKKDVEILEMRYKLATINK